MGFKKWSVAEYDKNLAKELAYECNVDPIIALIASSRGYTDPMDLEQFISDEPVFSDPTQMADIVYAAEIVNAAIENGEKIAVYGDYDCDGITATALLYNYLKSRSADCIYYIPNRFDEGYGMNCQAVEALNKKGVKLIITVDNGIASTEEIKLANKFGMEVVVTDHHLPADELPPAAAVVDPHRKDCQSSFKSICGAQVAFRLICVMENKEPEELLPLFADILCVAVIADIMPLRYENRTIVKYGIEKLKTNASKGLSAILNVAGISKDNITASKIAFGICPRINAAGRMGDASRAVELLTTDNMMEALAIANEIDSENAHRQQIEKNIFKQAIEIIEKENLMYDRVIVVVGQDWHHGVVGIVASKIAEKYGKPTILLSSDGEYASGSGRSIEGFSLFDAISSVKELTEKFGGHKQAAGLTIKTDNIDKFREKINSYALDLPFVAPILNLDCKLKPSALTLDLVDCLSLLEPFGAENKQPVFGLFGMVLSRITPIGNNKHLRLLFTKDTTTVQCLLFGVNAESFCFEVGDLVDLAVTVDKNVYNGEENLSVQIKAIRMADTDDEKLFYDIDNLEKYFSFNDTNFNAILPERAQVGEIYKYICEKTVSCDRIKYKFINTIGVAKTVISLKVLEELGLVNIENGFYKANKAAQKTNLINSSIFKDLTERGGKSE